MRTSRMSLETFIFVSSSYGRNKTRVRRMETNDEGLFNSSSVYYSFDFLFLRTFRPKFKTVHIFYVHVYELFFSCICAQKWEKCNKSRASGSWKWLPLKRDFRHPQGPVDGLQEYQTVSARQSLTRVFFFFSIRANELAYLFLFFSEVCARGLAAETQFKSMTRAGFKLYRCSRVFCPRAKCGMSIKLRVALLLIG